MNRAALVQMTAHNQLVTTPAAPESTEQVLSPDEGLSEHLL